jgi:Ca2+-binding RTX toxin-like protein
MLGVASTAKGGGGNDKLYGDDGDNTLNGGGGNDKVVDAPDPLALVTGGKDTLIGGGGNDRLESDDGVKDKTINCGPGNKDRATIDKNDPKPKGCEKVKKV